MKNYFIILLLITGNSFAQNSNCLGAWGEVDLVLKISGEFSESDSIIVYNLDRTVNFKIKDNRVDGYNEIVNFPPFTFVPDDLTSFSMAIHSIKDKRIYVFLDKKNETIGYVDINKFLLPQSLQYFVTNSLGAVVMSEKTKVFQEMSESSTPLDVPKSILSLKQEDLVGDWLRISYPLDDRFQYGWIKWKEGDCILVTFFNE